MRFALRVGCSHMSGGVSSRENGGQAAMSAPHHLIWALDQLRTLTGM